MKIVMGTRGSLLALTQARMIAEQLRKFSPSFQIEIKTIKTTGDKFLDLPLSKIGDKGLFVKELESALQNKEIDLAVHSVKDLPSEIPEDLFLAAFPQRENPQDVLVTRNHLEWSELPEGAVIGTSSLRRQAQLLFHRPDLKIETLRGNVDTRLRRLDEGRYFGVVLAQAGLSRLGIKRGTPIPFEVLLPSPGQGALAIEIRKNDTSLAQAVRALNDEAAALCVNAERSFLRTMQGGCQIPLGAYARISDVKLVMEGVLAEPDGSSLIRKTREGALADAVEIGKKLAEMILEEARNFTF